MPRVFISYSHDSAEHKRRVRALADRLRTDGIEAWIDLYAQDPDEGWLIWMRSQVAQADRVLLVFTETYARRFLGAEEQGIGRGVTFEGVLATQALYESGARNAKFRPVVFAEEDAQFIPPELRRFNRYRVDTPENYEALLRWLHGQAGIVAPKIGPKPEFKPEPIADLFATGDVHLNEPARPASAEDLRLLRQLADRVRNFWVAGVLEPSVHQAAMIALRTEPVGDAVQHPWERVLELPDRLRQPLPSEKKVGEVFSTVGALLILGEPGAGKTVTLLELARDLLVRFEADPGQPLPVVLHLSAWREARGSRTNSTSFSIWVEDELKDKYFVPARRTHAWLAKSRLCLLLDGLDEVRVQERAGCVRAINEFVREIGVSGIAVCSRVTEYVAIGERLCFSGAIRIQPLTQWQIDEYLERAGSGLAALRHEVQKDPVLQELARSPLMLGVMALAYQDLSFGDIVDPSATTVENRRKRVFDRYVARMFRRAPREASASYPEDHAKHWLGWLAARMAEHSRSVFRLEDLQPSWLPSSKQRMAYALSSRLIAAIVTSALVWAVARMLEPLLAPEWHMELKSNLQNINPVLAAGATVGIVLGLKSSRRFTGRVKDQSLGSGYWRYMAEALLVTLIIVGVFGALAAPHFESVTLSFWGGCSVIFWSLVNYRVIRNQQSFQLVPITAANDIRLGGPYRPSFAAAFKKAKPAARGMAIMGGSCLMVVILLWLLIGLLFQPSALLRIDTYKDSAFVFLKLALIAAVYGAAYVASVGVWNAMGEPTDLPDTATPGQGLSFSLRNAALSGVVAVLGMFLFTAGQNVGGLVLYDYSPYRTLLEVTFQSLCFGVLAASWNGGFDVLKHLTLRFLLRRQNLIPRDLVAFLEHATRLVFLRKIGPGYIFIHRLLLEHFAGIQEPLETAPMVSGDETSRGAPTRAGTPRC